MLSIFVATFLNTGIIILLINADLKEAESEYLNTIFHLGHATDFNQYWYDKVGNGIVNTMIINIAMPYVDLAVSLVKCYA